MDVAEWLRNGLQVRIMQVRVLSSTPVISVLRSTDRILGYEPGDGGSIPSGPAKMPSKGFIFWVYITLLQPVDVLLRAFCTVVFLQHFSCCICATTAFFG